MGKEALQDTGICTGCADTLAFLCGSWPVGEKGIVTCASIALAVLLTMCNQIYICSMSILKRVDILCDVLGQCHNETKNQTSALCYTASFLATHVT